MAHRYRIRQRLPYWDWKYKLQALLGKELTVDEMESVIDYYKQGDSPEWACEYFMFIAQMEVLHAAQI